MRHLAQCLVHRKDSVNANNKFPESDPAHRVLFREPSLLICKSAVIISLFVHATPTMSQILFLYNGGYNDNMASFFLWIQPTREADNQQVNR